MFYIDTKLHRHMYKSVFIFLTAVMLNVNNSKYNKLSIGSE
jgi:hypothetical protein